MTTASPVKNVVLVHGGFVDGSGWQGVYDRPGRRPHRAGLISDDDAVTAEVGALAGPEARSRGAGAGAPGGAAASPPG